jgi:hypothetical protein
MSTPTGDLDGVDPVTVDLWLRQGLTAAVRSGDDPIEVYAEMVPRFARARRRQRVREVALSAAAAVLVLGGVGVLVADHLERQQAASLVVAADPAAPQGPGPAIVVRVAERTVEVTGTTVADGSTGETAPGAGDDPPAGGAGDPSIPTGDDAAAPADPPAPSEAERQPAPTVLGRTTVSDGSTGPAPPARPPESTARTATTGQTPTTAAPSSTTTTTRRPGSDPSPPSGATVFDSSCGSIEVGLDDGAIVLIAVDPRPGYSHVVESSGRQELEVKLRGSHRECEFHVRVHRGSLSAEHGE